MINLAFRFVLHMLKKPFTRRKGKQLFLDNYRADHIFPLPVEVRRRLPELSRCLSCGLCDTVCPNLSAARRHLFNGPSELASCQTRSLPHYHLLGSALENWRACGECRECENICPTSLPLRDLARLVEEIMKAQSQLQSSLKPTPKA